jgi:hypothetical protein
MTCTRKKTMKIKKMKMKIKKLLLVNALVIGFTSTAVAQNVPSYIPKNGLVGWWPFNGNANDESGNRNDGTVVDGTLGTDRKNSPNSSYDFSGGYVTIADTNYSVTTQITVSAWVNLRTNSYHRIATKHAGCCNGNYGWMLARNAADSSYEWRISNNGNNWDGGNSPSGTSKLDTWQFLVATYDGRYKKIYIDGVEKLSLIGDTGSIYKSSLPLSIGRDGQSSGQSFGKIDDVGIWNRALSQQEITALYISANCAKNTTITPQKNSLTTSSTASFTANTSDSNPNYIWQSDLGQGFQTLNNFGNYSGVNIGTLNITNVQLPNHTQPIRVISTSGNCIDTSNVALIDILDTCITKVIIYDTLLTTVTDTLIINAIITGLNPPSNKSTLKVFPNPANSHITIDYGNFNSLNGYTIKIVNSIGQTVFTAPINKQTSYIDLSSWTGNGIYFVQLIDPQSNTIENRKIVIK